MCLFAPYYIIERKLLSVLKVKRLVCNKNRLREKQLCSFQNNKGVLLCNINVFESLQ